MKTFRVVVNEMNADGTVGELHSICEFDLENPTDPHDTTIFGIIKQYEAEEIAAEAAKPYEVFDLKTDYSHGKFATLEEARAAVSFDRLQAYSIWNNSNNTRVEQCDPYEGDDDRVKQALGEPNASEHNS